MHLVESLLRKLRAHSGHWSELPEVTVPSAAVDDTDVEHWSDMRYMQELVDEIATVCHTTRGRITDQGLAEFDVDIYLAPWPADQAELLLAAWREQVAA
jgi:hypothetical protein